MKDKIDRYLQLGVELDKVECEISGLLDKISTHVCGQPYDTITEINKDYIEFETYFSGCGTEDYSFSTKLLYLTEEELDNHFDNERKKQIRKEKRDAKNREKANKLAEEKLYKKLKIKYEDKNV